MSTLTTDQLTSISIKARGLDLEGCLDFLGVSLDDLDHDQLVKANVAHRKGRAEGISLACDKLFSHMSTRNGGQTAIAYLQAMAGTFKVDASPNPGSGNGFQFNVTMTED
jgi:hypothetical protein